MRHSRRRQRRHAFRVARSGDCTRHQNIHHRDCQSAIHSALPGGRRTLRTQPLHRPAAPAEGPIGERTRLRSRFLASLQNATTNPTTTGRSSGTAVCLGRLVWHFVRLIVGEASTANYAKDAKTTRDPLTPEPSGSCDSRGSRFELVALPGPVSGGPPGQWALLRSPVVAFMDHAERKGQRREPAADDIRFVSKPIRWLPFAGPPRWISGSFV